jgi:hypothetical protein
VKNKIIIEEKRQTDKEKNFGLASEPVIHSCARGGAARKGPESKKLPKK